VGNEALSYVGAVVSRWPGMSGAILRRWFYARRLATLGPGATVGPGLLVHGPSRIAIGARFTCWRECVLAACDDGWIRIGNGVGLNQGAYLNACNGGRIEIGDDVIVGPYAVLRTSDHRFADPARPIVTQGHEPASIVIESDVWLGAHVTVVGGVRIGRGSVVAAGAVVTKDVEPMTLVAGVPARPIRRRDGALGSDRP
jgi:galactoside O-acetyltransferase